ncbi:unnamed protein product [Ambrosiozyma monospora]|uniref:Unnamed protein product n=1 Tax=Ambrosiozyma monospora TaxID=43982 RepID=A0ACB5T0Q6_AMBMO|nr:unnamed protein product [Ambrosiozyma monospora]
MSESSSIPATQTALQVTGSTDPLLKYAKNAIVPKPGPNDILLRVKANAINPADWKRISSGKFPSNVVPGADASGEVVAIGSKVKGFQIGDHISSFKSGGHTVENGGGFQEYTLIDPYLSINYGKRLMCDLENYVVTAGPVTTFEGAASVPTGLVTVGLSFYHNLQLSFDKSQQKDKKIVIWGGATATGFLGVQVAKKVFGLTVLAVASSKNHKTLKKAGADYTFDYHDPNVVQEIQKVGGENLVFGYDTVANHSTINQLYRALSSTKPVILENLLGLTEDIIEEPRDNVKLTYSLGSLARGDLLVGGQTIPSSPEFQASHLAFWKEIQKYIIDGTIEHAPLWVLPNGLGSIEEALHLSKNNKVSLQKLVIRTDDTKL